MGFLE